MLGHDSEEHHWGYLRRLVTSLTYSYSPTDGQAEGPPGHHPPRVAIPTPKGRSALGKKLNHYADSNVPMEIATYLLSYHKWLLEKKYISDSAAGKLYDYIVALQTQVVQLERIKNTPLPFAYQAHLQMSVWYVLPLLTGNWTSLNSETGYIYSSCRYVAHDFLLEYSIQLCRVL